MTDESPQGHVLPEELVKFRGLTGHDYENSRRIICDSVIRFSNRRFFNDPFDCRIHYSRVSRIALLAYMNHESNIPNYISLQRIDGLSTIQRARGLNKKGFISHMQRTLQDRVNTVGVLSLSSCSTDTLLWSHYADKHRGICLHFSPEVLEEVFPVLAPLTYRSTYPSIDVASTPFESQMSAFFLTKSTRWKYEKEWRVLDLEEGEIEKKFPEEMLTRITLGASTRMNHCREILKWNRARARPVSVFQAKLDQRAYKLHFEQL